MSVASNSVLKIISQCRPTTLEELAALPDVRQWQVRDFGPTLLALLDEHAPLPLTSPAQEAPDSDAKKTSRTRRRRRRRKRKAASAAAPSSE